MKEQFNLYAQYYDLLYKDKDYKKEAEYVHKMIQKYKPEAKTLLSLGCGTGKYEFELEKFGYEVFGIDLSQQMIDIANQARGDSNSEFIQGDIREIRLDKKFDVVISLFHVMNYQTTNEDLIKAFETAALHLRKNGIFLFDFWYGPAVLTDLPKKKTKFIENEKISILRKTTPVMHVNKNVVDVSFDIEVCDKLNGKKYIFSELHKMRYLFLPEISLFLDRMALSFVATNKWMLFDDEPSNSSWYSLVVSEKK